MKIRRTDVARPSKLIRKIRLVREADTDPDLSYLGEYSDKPAKHSIDRKACGDQGRNEFRYFNLGTGDPEDLEEDYKRMEAYNAQEWGMCGVWAEAEICVNGVIQTIKSGGLWGIESDSDEAYFVETEQAELHELTKILAKLGFAKWAITAATKTVERTT